MMNKTTLFSLILVSLLILNTNSFAQNLNDADWDYKYSIEIDNAFIDAELTNWTLVFDQSFSSLLTAANGPLDADGSRPSKNGGGDIRFSSDENGNNELAFDLRAWVTDNDPSTATCEVAVKIPVVSETNNTAIYMWWGNSSANAYGVSETDGQYNAYDVNYALVSPNGGDADRTTNQWNVTASGDASGGDSDGKVGSSASFGGTASQDFFEYNNVASWNDILSFDTSWTMECIAANANPASTLPQFMISKVQGTSDYRGCYLLYFDGVLSCGFNETHNPATRVQKEKTFVMVQDQWYYISGTYNGVNDADGLNIYIDGLLQTGTNDDEVGTVTNTDHNDPLLVGARNWGAPNTMREWDGLLDEIRVSKTERSSAWLKANYHDLFKTSGFLTFADATLSNSVNSTLSIGVYPNPTRNSWTIQTKSQMIYSVEVYNVLGERVYYSNPNATSVRVNASNLAPGLYFSTINTDQGNVTKKLIKN